MCSVAEPTTEKYTLSARHKIHPNIVWPNLNDAFAKMSSSNLVFIYDLYKSAAFLFEPCNWISSGKKSLTPHRMSEYEYIAPTIILHTMHLKRMYCMDSVSQSVESWVAIQQIYSDQLFHDDYLISPICNWIDKNQFKSDCIDSVLMELQWKKRINTNNIWSNTLWQLRNPI